MPDSKALLAKLQFGKPSAEDDFEGLKRYFVEGSYSGRINSGENRFLLGNRGAGKSALLRMAAEREHLANQIVIELRPSDYSYQMLAEVTGAGAEEAWAKQGYYAAAWKYTLLILTMKELAAAPQVRTKLTKEERKLLKFIRDAYLGQALVNPIEVLTAYISRLRGSQTIPMDGIRSAELTKLYRVEELDAYLTTMDEGLRKSRVSIFVDELDTGWDASEDAKAFVAGLFQACTTLNRRNENLRIFVSLRQELYDNIPALYDDTQKYRDLFTTIRWDSKSLTDLIVKRIVYYVPELKNLSDDEVIEAVFGSRDVLEYILDRSLYRPRDLIFFADLALRRAREITEKLPIPEQAVLDVELDYSTSRMNDLGAEYRFQYPELGDIFNVFRAGPALLDRDEILELLLSVSVGDAIPPSRHQDWYSGKDPDELLRILWNIGFLLVMDSANSAGAAGHFRVGSADDPSLDIYRAEKFRVSPLFNRALGLEL